VILQAASKVFAMPVTMIVSRNKARSVSRVRQIVQHMAVLARVDTLREIGVKTGGRSHSTVLNSFKAISGELDVYERMRWWYRETRRTLNDLGYDTKPLKITKDNARVGFNDVLYKREFVREDGRMVPVRIIEVDTGEATYVRSMRQAAAITGVNLSAIKRRVNGVRSSVGGYKFDRDG